MLLTNKQLFHHRKYLHTTLLPAMWVALKSSNTAFSVINFTIDRRRCKLIYSRIPMRVFNFIQILPVEYSICISDTHISTHTIAKTALNVKSALRKAF